MSLGKPIREEVPDPEAKWEPVPGKPHLARHSITGKLATKIPANEAVNHPWPNWPLSPKGTP